MIISKKNRELPACTDVGTVHQYYRQGEDHQHPGISISDIQDEIYASWNWMDGGIRAAKYTSRDYMTSIMLYMAW